MEDDTPHPPPPPTPPQVLLFCCGRPFLSQAELDTHQRVKHSQSSLEDEGDEEEYFEHEETHGMTEQAMAAFRLKNAQFERLKEDEAQGSAVFNTNLPPRVNRNAGLIERLNEVESDDDEGSPPASPSQVKPKTPSNHNTSLLQAVGEQRQYKCPHCIASYVRADFLQTHTSIWHSDGKNKLPGPHEGSNPEEEVEEEEYDEPEDDQKDKDDDDDEDMGSEGSDDVPCPMPGCLFKSSLGISDSLATHLQAAHNNSGRFQCPQCPSNFRYPFSLTTHVQEAHSNDPTAADPSSSNITQAVVKKKYKKRKTKCLQCDYVAVPQHIRRHMRTAHSNEGTFRCLQCPCVFDSRRQLAIHMGVHVRKDNKTAEALRQQNMDLSRPEDDEAQQLSCSRPRCIYKTQWPNLMEQHVTTAHVEGGLPCEYCGCTFNTDLARLTHTGSIHPVQGETTRNAVPIRWQVRKTGIAGNGITHSRPVPRSRIFKVTRPFKCTRCCYSSTNSINFKFHSQVCARRHHRNNQGYSNHGQQTLRESAEPQQPPHFPRASDKEALQTPSTSPQPSQVDAEGSPIYKAPGQQIMSSGKVRMRTYTSCPMCGSRHEGIRHLNDHVERCHVEGGVPCPSCSCTFKSAVSMALHNNRVHVQGKSRFVSPCQGPSALLKHSGKAPLSSSYSCQKCPFVARKRIQLTEHIKRSHVEGGLQCIKCPCAFATSVGLGTHMEQVHGDRRRKPSRPPSATATGPSQVTGDVTKKIMGTVKVFRCHRCPYTTQARSSFSIHFRKAHVEGGVACFFCPCTLASEHARLTHIQMIHRSEKQPNDGTRSGSLDPGQCPECAAQFPTAALLTYHMNCVHQKHGARKDDTVKTQTPPKITPSTSTSVNSNISSVPEPPKVVLGGGVLRCRGQGCSFLTLLPSSFEKHKTVCVAPPLQVTGETNSAEAKEKSTEPDETKSAEPDEKESAEVVEKEESVQCDKCKSTFRSSRHLDFHMEKAHVADGFACRWCTRSYKTYQSLTVHIAKVHGQRGVHRDKVKGKAAKRKGKPPVQRISAVPDTKARGGGPLRCSACPLRFKSAWDYSIHTNSAHVPGGTKCPLCPCTFASDKIHRQHLSSVHNYNSKQSKQKAKVHKCPSCPYISIHSSKDLNRHMKAAHVPGGVACMECPCSYRNRRSLEQHYLKKHPGQDLPAEAPSHPGTPPSASPSQPSPSKKVKPKDESGFCDVCKVDYLKYCYLIKHRASAHVDGGEACPHCPRSYKTNHGLMFHIKTKHREQCSKVKEEEAVETKKLICVLCGDSPPFESFDDFSAHLLEAHSHSHGTHTESQMDSRPSSSISSAVVEAPGLPEHRRSSSRLLGRSKRMLEDEEHAIDEDDNQQKRNRLDKPEDADPTEVDESVPSGPSVPAATTENDEKMEEDSGGVKCGLCDYVTSQQYSLNTHLRRSHVVGGKGCPFCPVTTATQRGLDTHIRYAHEGQEPPPAVPAPVVAPLPQTKPAQTNKLGKTVPCRICEWTGESLSAVEVHEETCHVKEARESEVLIKKSSCTSASLAHECPECSYSFATQFALNVHMALAKTEPVHFQRLPRVEEQEESTREKEVANALEELAESWKDDGSGGRAQKSPKNKQPLEKVVSSEAPPVPLTKTKVMKPALRPVRCWLCKESFIGIQALESHKLLVHANPPEQDKVASPIVTIPKRYKCGRGGCPLIFKTHEELTRHSLITHSSTDGLHSTSTPKQLEVPSNGDEGQKATEKEKDAEGQLPKKSCETQKEGASKVTSLPRPIIQGRVLPPGSSWINLGNNKIDNGWRLAEASSKASTLWTIEKKTGDDDFSSSQGDESDSSASSRESHDVTKDSPRSPKKLATSMTNADQTLETKKHKLSSDVEVSPKKALLSDSKQDTLQFTLSTIAARKRQKQSLNDVNDVQILQEKSSESPGSSRSFQSPKVTTSLSGRPVQKTAESTASTASFISKVITEERVAELQVPQASLQSGQQSVNQPQPSSSDSWRRPEVDSTSNKTDDVVEIRASAGAEDFIEPDSTTPNRRGDWLKEFMRFMCSRCSYSFGTSSLLAKHFQVCAGACASFVCVLCESPRHFNSLLLLKEHIWDFHRPPTYSESVASVYSCSLCKLELADRKAFICHISVPHLFRCKKCSFVCNTRGKMDEHKETRHRELAKSPKSVSGHRSSTTSTSSQQSTSSEAISRNGRCTCGANFDRIIDFRAHVMRCKDLKGDASTVMQPTRSKDEVACVLDVAAANTSENVTTNDRDVKEECDSLVCVRCGYVASSTQDAREHANVVASNESRICELCGYVAASTCDLTLHSRESCDTSINEPTVALSSQQTIRPFTPVVGIDVGLINAAKVPTPSKEKVLHVEGIVLNADQLDLSLENQAEQPLTTPEVHEGAQNTKNPR